MRITKKRVNRACLPVAMLVLLWIAVVPGIVSGLSDSPTSPIVIRGSRTLLPVVEIWVDAYRRTISAADFDVEATGSSRGIEDLLAGRANIAMASRPMNETEELSAQRKGQVYRETVVARMGIAVVINRDNPVTSISVDDLAKVFSGAVRSWKEIGGPDESITVVRKTSGWSPEFFRRRIMGDREYASESLVVDSKEEIVAEVGRRTWSIGVTGMPDAIPALDQVHLVRLISETSDEDSTYALSRPLFFYTAEGSTSLQPFLEFVTSAAAQDLIAETGMYPARQADAIE